MTGFLDKPEVNNKSCVIFQNVNGSLLMHYGIDSFKKNIGANTNRTRI